MNLPNCANSRPRSVPTGPTVPHHTYIGGSDISAIAGMNPYSSGLDVWAEKTRAIPPQEGTEVTEMGDHLERPLMELYARRRGVELSYPGTLIDPYENYLGATPDGIANSAFGVQCKLVGYESRRRWDHPDMGEDAIPPEVYVQVQWESRAIEKHYGWMPERAEVVAGIGTELPIYVVIIDPELVASLETLARRFWREHVEANVMPEVTTENHETLRRIMEARYPSHMSKDLLEPTDEVLLLAAEYDAQRELEKRHKKAKELAGSQIAELIAECAGFSGQGVKATWKKREGESVKWKDVAAELNPSPELIKKHSTELGRSLYVKVKKDT